VVTAMGFICPLFTCGMSENMGSIKEGRSPSQLAIAQCANMACADIGVKPHFGSSSEGW
jgi:hypothetical protein